MSDHFHTVGEFRINHTNINDDINEVMLANSKSYRIIYDRIVPVLYSDGTVIDEEYTLPDMAINPTNEERTVCEYCGRNTLLKNEMCPSCGAPLA